MATKTAYTPETEAKIASMYAELGNEGLEAIADDIGRTKRAVIGKLVHMGLYVKAEPKAPAPKPEGPTKAELMAELVALGEAVGVDMTDGLANASKVGIESVIAALVSAGVTVDAVDSES